MFSQEDNLLDFEGRASLQTNARGHTQPVNYI